MATGDRDLRGAQGADDGDFQQPTMRDTMCGLAPSILVNGVLTLVAYQVLVSQHVSSVMALISTCTGWKVDPAAPRRLN